MNEYNETIKELVKEHFGTGPIPKKVWLVMTDDTSNIANVRVTSGRFYPATLLEGIHAETAAEAAATYRRCCHRKVWAVVETEQEAMEVRTFGTIVLWNGKIVRRDDADYE